MIKNDVHADPNHPAIAAILAFDLDAFSNHGDIAAALAPHVAAAPALREWDGDDEWTAVEEACSAAALFVDGVANPVGDDPWMRCQNQIDRLRKMQVCHRERVVLDRLGAFPGFKIRAQCRWSLSVSVRVWQDFMAVDLDVPILSLDGNATRREVGIAIASWKAGHERGLREGADQVRDGIKNLLQIEAA